ncbi:MAG: DUF4382 domain-containing protein [Bacteroidota bacterium]
MKKISVFLLSALSILFTTACNKESTNNNNGTTKVAIRLTDAPGDYEAVYIDVQSVTVETETKGWIEVPLSRKGVYNLLDFRNGLDTLLCQVDLPVGRMSQIRMVLGANNAIKVGGVVYPLKTPSAMQSGLKFNVQHDLLTNVAYTIWIDFDASRSIVENGNGDYSLKPVIRTYTELTNGKIKGSVLPLYAFTVVYAINGADTFSAIPNADGSYVFCGLPEGSYTVQFDAKAGTGVADLELKNVQVKFGVITDLGKVVLIP